MLPKFLESLGENVTKEWLTKILLPSLVFWLGGALALCSKFGWESVKPLLSARDPQNFPLNYLIAALLVIAVSAAIVQRNELNMLRLLEGYWPNWLSFLRRWRIRAQAGHFDRCTKRRKELLDRYDSLSPEEIDEFVRLDWQRKQTPKQIDRLMPTRLGNILRAAERRSLEKYELEVVVCFPRLWLLLPGEVKAELTEARAQLNGMVRIWIWSVLFLVWGIWSWWAIPVAISSAWLAYGWMLDAAVIGSIPVMQ
jgi:hypothetical protein